MTDTAPPASGRRFPLVPVLIVLALLGVALFGERGVMCALESRQEKEGLEAKVAALEGANRKLREEIDALRSDPGYIETVARQELGMVRGDELVYQFRARSQEGASEVAAGTPVEKDGSPDRIR